MATRALVAMVMACAAACGCVHTDFANTSGVVVPARSADCHLDVFFRAPPPYPYVVLGLVSTNSMAPPVFAIGETDITVIRRMMEEACTIGAQGLMNVTAYSEPVRVGKGHWKSSNGSALAFVYVDPSGRRVPPPNVPRLVMQASSFPLPAAPVKAKDGPP